MIHTSQILQLQSAPRDHHPGGAVDKILFAVGDCPLGSMLVAMSDKGIVAILLGDDAAALVHDLEDSFPKAELIVGDRAFQNILSKVAALVEAPDTGLDLPLDVRRTAFQQCVWHALREISVGTTATYSEIAERVGTPNGARAVAAACAENRIAVAVPCHRVVRSDGSLSGYRWGAHRKRTLLAREAKS